MTKLFNKHKTLSVLKVFMILSLWLTSSCKKGEDDPLISLRTRKARLCGNWSIESGTYYILKGNTSAIYSETFRDYTKNTYSEKRYDYNSVTIPPPNITEGLFEFRIEFNKNGRFESFRQVDNHSLILKGFWAFSSGIGKNKNKEQVVLRTDSVIENGVLYPPSNVSTNSVDFTYRINELRNKKIVLVNESFELSENKQENVLKEEYTFLQ